MKIYKKLETENKDNEYKFDYNFGINNLYNINNVQEENEKKFDTILNGILFNSTTIKNMGKFN